MQDKLTTVTIAAGVPGTVTLLQRGVLIHAESGMSIREFMVDAIGLAPDYAENRVRTIFLNSSPVDDIDGIKIKDGDIISLSGALPGICGIAMGRDTVISAFRTDISATAAEEDILKGDAVIQVKMFNLVASEAGQVLLQRGVIVEAATIIKSLGENAPQDITPDSGPVLLKI